MFHNEGNLLVVVCKVFSFVTQRVKNNTNYSFYCWRLEWGIITTRWESGKI